MNAPKEVYEFNMNTDNILMKWEIKDTSGPMILAVEKWSIGFHGGELVRLIC